MTSIQGWEWIYFFWAGFVTILFGWMNQEGLALAKPFIIKPILTVSEEQEG
jgi:hypothetical protein